METPQTRELDRKYANIMLGLILTAPKQSLSPTFSKEDFPYIVLSPKAKMEDEDE